MACKGSIILDRDPDRLAAAVERLTPDERTALEAAALRVLLDPVDDDEARLRLAFFGVRVLHPLPPLRRRAAAPAGDLPSEEEVRP